MRGSVWSLLVVAVGAGIFLTAVDAAVPTSPSSETDAVVDVLATLSPFAGWLLALVAIGALVVLSMGRGW